MKFAHILALCAGTASLGVCGIEFDMVSDLNGTGDTTVHVHESDTAHGKDAVEVNNQSPVREPTAQAKSVKPAVKTDDVDPASKPLSLRDQISSALKGEGDTPDAAQINGGPARNPDGTFAPKPADVPAADPAAPVVAATAPQGIDPTVFNSLPAETQASLARTMDEIAQSQTRFSRLAPIEELIAPRIDAWALNGMQPAQAVHQLLALSDFASRDAPGFIKYFAQQSGVSLEDIVLGMDPAEQVDPTIKALQDQIAELQGARNSDAQRQAQAAHETMVNSVVDFASEKGPDGQPLRPYFEELGNAVLPFISAVKAQNPTWTHAQVLQDAYDRAVWGTPSTRAKMQAAVDAAGQAERLRQGGQRVEKARVASASVANGAPSSPPAAPNDTSRSLRDTIKASMAAAQ